MVKAVAGETPLLLKMENEGPDFVLTDLGQIGILSFGNEEVLKVAHVVDDNSRGVRAFALGGSTELVTLK